MKSSDDDNEDIGAPGGAAWNWTLVAFLDVQDPNYYSYFPADSVIIRDQLPSSPALSYGTPVVSGTAANIGVISCSIDGSDLLECIAEGFAAQIFEEQELVVTIPVSASAPGTYTNSESLCRVNPLDQSFEGGSGSANNDCNVDEVTVTAAGNDLSIYKEFDPAFIVVDEVTSLVLALTNLTGSEITGLRVVDNFPANVEVAGTPGFISGDCGGSANFDPSISVANTGFEVENIDIQPGDTCEIRVPVTGTAAGVYTNDSQNNVTVTDDGEPTTYPAFSATLTVYDLGTDDAIKTVSPSSAYLGETMTVTLAFYIEQDSSVSYSDDPIPAFVSGPTNYTEIEGGGGGECSWDPPSIGTNAISGTIYEDSDDQDVLCVVQFEVLCEAVGAADNTLTYNGDQTSVASMECLEAPPPPPSGGGGASTQTDGGPTVVVSDPAVSKNGSPDNAIVGEAVTWTITVSNPGTQPIDNVVVQDAVPPQFDIVSATATQGSVDVSGQNVTANIGTLNGGASVVVTINTIANDTALPGTVCNTGVVGGSASVDCVTFFPDALPPTGGPSPLMAALRAILPVIALIGLAGAGAYAFMRRRLH